MSRGAWRQRVARVGLKQDWGPGRAGRHSQWAGATLGDGARVGQRQSRSPAAVMEVMGAEQAGCSARPGWVMQRKTVD
jgi:hypothetical protein